MQKYIVTTIILLFGIIACEEGISIKRNYPIVKTLSVTDIDNDGTVTFNAELSSIGSSDVIDHGFVWGLNDNLNLESGAVGSLGAIQSIGNFFLEVNSGLVSGESYFVRAFARNESKTVYGEIVTFESVRNSPPIVLEDFNPKNGTWLDIITITGQYFDSYNEGNTSVKFGTSAANITEITNQSITVEVPIELLTSSSNIEVTTSGITESTQELFVLNGPQIDSVDPLEANVGQTVTISGSNFYPINTPTNQLLIDSKNSSLTSVSQNEINFIVPTLGTGNYNIELSVLDQSTTFNQQISIIGPTAGEFLPISGPPGSEVIISGSNFSLDVSQIQVLFNDVEATIVENSSTNLKVIVPGLTSGDYMIEVINDGIPIQYSGLFMVTSLPVPTDYIAYFPFSGNANDVSGSGYNGTLIGTPTLTADRYGTPNSAYDFNDVSDEITTSTEIDQNLVGGATFSVWIFPKEIAGVINRTIISNYNGQGTPGDCNGRIGFFLRLWDDASISFQYRVDGNDQVGVRTSAGTIITDEWQHIAFTWSGSLLGSSLDNFKIHLDGSEIAVNLENVGSINCAGGTFIESEDPFRFGRHECAAGPCSSFEGAIDDIRIYDRVLSDEEIMNLAVE